MIENTRDLSKFGYREIRETIDLLTGYLDNTAILDDGVAVEFNPNSGNVFLVDENYNVAMMNRDKLEKWYNCPYCGHEGFLEDMQHEAKDQECTDYMIEIGAIEKSEDN